MKKLTVFLAAVICLVALCVPISSNERHAQDLEVKLFCEVNGKYYFADVAEGKSDDIRVGETMNISFTDFSEFKSAVATPSAKFGIMLVDDNGGEGELTYHISDLSVKLKDGQEKKLSAEGTFTDKLKKGVYEDDTAIVHHISITELGDKLSSVSSANLSINVISYNDTGLSTAESIPEEQEPVPDMNEPPKTGVSADFLPLLFASLAIIAVYKNR